jgi:putative glutathione S-transferase
VADYPNLAAYVRRLLAAPAFRESTSEEHIKRGYYSIAALNPNGVIPLGPLNPFGLAAQETGQTDVAVERHRAGARGK